MTTRYQKRHYEDVARLLSEHIGPCVPRSESNCPTTLAAEFADLFAADNPPHTCVQCGRVEGRTGLCLPDEPAVEHSFRGFGRERFLAACGLESEGRE